MAPPKPKPRSKKVVEESALDEEAALDVAAEQETRELVAAGEQSGPIRKRVAPAPVSSPATTGAEASQSHRAYTPEQGRTAVILRALETFHSLGAKLIKYGTFVALAYCAVLALRVIGGANQDIGHVVKAIADMKIWDHLGWVVATVTTGSYIGERRLRKKTIKQLGPHIAHLEEKHDPRRMRSGLTSTGAPPAEDEDAP